MLERTDLQQICSFILLREETTTQTSSHEERLEEARKIAYYEEKFFHVLYGTLALRKNFSGSKPKLL